MRVPPAPGRLDVTALGCAQEVRRLVEPLQQPITRWGEMAPAAVRALSHPRVITPEGAVVGVQDAPQAVEAALLPAEPLRHAHGLLGLAPRHLDLMTRAVCCLCLSLCPPT